MRKRRKGGGLTVNAIAGTHVVTLGFDLTEARRKGCLGFAIQRTDHTEDEQTWMKGMKTFQATDPGLGPGGEIASREHPFQSFQWADYSAKPEHDYTYEILPLSGTPQKLRAGASVAVRVSTESEVAKPHAVFFNRGAVASQEYARRFMNQKPDDVGPPAYRWLSRGLLEAFQAFVARAAGPRFSLHGAVYEFQWADALAAIKRAARTGAKVSIIYDGIAGSSGPKALNEAAIAQAKLGKLCRPRTKGKIMHDKFLVLSRDDRPIAVWTGSTNLTENGLFGHLNAGHVIEDDATAAAYRAVWNQLSGDPTPAEDRDGNDAHNPNPPDPWDGGLRAVFSPRPGLRVLDWYAELAGRARSALFMTFAFGMHKSFQEVYDRSDGLLRMALMEKEGNGAGLAQGKIDIRRIRARPNVVVAVGNNIVTNSFDRWLAERRSLTAEANVRYVHTKFMLVDPLSDQPVVVTGSANFSAASTNANDENMLVIQGDTRVADIYLGEFMRSFSHYAFREAVKIARERGETDWRPSFLVPDASWQKDYFTPKTSRFLRRVYFSGKD